MRVYNSVGIEKLISLGFLSVILVGTLTIYTLNAFAGQTLPLVDVLFTVSSATCVTGLAVFDVGSLLTIPSQIALLALMQIGGLGLMTVATALPLLLKQRIDLKSRLKLAGGLGINTPQGAVFLLKRILLYTLFIQSTGAAFLFLGFLRHGEPVGRSLYYACFHAISAFCNAGFSTYSDNLHSFSGSFLVPLITMALIVIGGMGFPVLSELNDYFKRRRHFLSDYSKTVLLSTSLLVLFSTFFFFLTEFNHAFKEMPPLGKLWNALFAAITPRTAGFETVAYTRFSELGAAFTIFLMIIGASPASTGGGIKTTTLAVFTTAVWSELHDQQDTVLFKRCVSPKTMRKALVLVVVYLGTLFLGAAILTVLEPASFANLLFEATSALGTVGLSRGITPELSSKGKIVLVCLMYWGRIGLITFFYTLMKRDKKTHVQYPYGDMPIG